MTWRVYNTIELGGNFYFDITESDVNPGPNDPHYMVRLSFRDLEWQAFYWDGDNNRTTYLPEFLALLSEEQKAEALAAAINHRNRGT